MCRIYGEERGGREKRWGNGFRMWDRYGTLLYNSMRLGM